MIPGVALVAALAVPLADGSPIKPVETTKVEVPASRQPGVPGETDMIVECRGNQRTAVLLKGDHRPVGDLEVLVFELPKGSGPEKLIAHGKGTKDLVGVVFVPDRAGPVRIVFRNHAEYKEKINPYNECYLAVK
jgi:hypothetical protein